MGKKYRVWLAFLVIGFASQHLLAYEAEQLVFSRDKTQLVYVMGSDIVKLSTQL